MKTLTKRILAVILSLTMILPVMSISFSATAADITSSGTCGESLTWSLDSDGVLTISGSGAMTTHPWTASSVKQVIINDGITDICAKAFANCTSLTSVSLNCNTLLTIGDSAFNSCSALTGITIPSGVTEIGGNVFNWCSKLADLSFASNVGLKSIGGYAFANCTSLTGATIPASVTSVGGGAFAGNTSMTEIKVGGGSTRYKSESGILFSYDGTVLVEYPSGKTDTSYTVPSTVNTVNYAAFEHTNALTSLVVSSGVAEIQDYAVNNCPALTSIDLKSSISYIGKYAFANCPVLTGISIPDTVTEIRNYAFYKDAALTGITIPDSVSSIGDNAFYYCSKMTKATLGSSVKSIGSSAFEGCGALSSVNIPDSVTSIGRSAFMNCSSLSEISIPGSVKDISDNMFNSCSALKNVYLHSGTESIGNNAFYNCAALTEIDIPGSVKSVGESAFEKCVKMTGVTMHDGTTILNKRAFYGCTGLVSAVLSNSINHISSSTFYNCSALENVNIPDNATYIDYDSFYNCSALKSIDIPDGVSSIGESAFEKCVSLTSVDLNVKSIGSSAFFGTGLTSVLVSASVTSIGSYAFGGCSSLEAFTVDDNNKNYSSADGVLFNKGKTTLMQYPENCKVTVYSVPSSVTTIQNGAFSNCKNIIELNIPDSAVNIGNIYGCPELVTLKMPKSVESVGLISHCESLKTVNIPEGITTLIDDMFYDDTSLENIVIPESVTNIGDYTFGNCSSLKTIYIPENVSKIDASDYTISHLTSNPINLFNNSVYYYLADGITMPGDDVTAAKITAFDGCSSLTSIDVDPDNTHFSSVDGVLFNKSQSLIKKYPENRPGETYCVPDSVQLITFFNEFSGCRNLINIYVENKNCIYPWYYVINGAKIYGQEYALSAAILKAILSSGAGTMKSKVSFKNIYGLADSSISGFAEDYGYNFVAIGGHSYGDWVTTKAASCIEDGLETHTCIYCGKTETRVIPAQHDWTDWKDNSDGTHTHYCKIDGATETEAHTWDNGVIVTSATTSSKGIKKFTCTKCGAVKTEETDEIAVSSVDEWSAAINSAKSGDTVSITLTKDIAATAKLVAVPTGVTVNLNMNGHSILWDYTGTSTTGVMNTSYPANSDYWGLITNNGTLTITGKGTIRVKQVMYNLSRNGKQDNYPGKACAIANGNGATMTVGSGVNVQTYLDLAFTDVGMYEDYNDIFLYTAGIYNEGTVTSAANITVGVLAGGTSLGNALSLGHSSYKYSFGYGIYGGNVTTTGGTISVGTYSGALGSNYSCKEKDQICAYSFGVYSNNAKILGTTIINVESTTWQDRKGCDNWGTDVSWAAGVLYLGENYPVIGPATNINASFTFWNDKHTLQLPGEESLTYSDCYSGDDMDNYGRRAYAVAGVEQNVGTIGDNTAEYCWNTDNKGFFGSNISYSDSECYLNCWSNKYYTENSYREGMMNNSTAVDVSSQNKIQSGERIDETKTSSITNGAPYIQSTSTQGGQYIVISRFYDCSFDSDSLSHVSVAHDSSYESKVASFSVNSAASYGIIGDASSVTITYNNDGTPADTAKYGSSPYSVTYEVMNSSDYAEKALKSSDESNNNLWNASGDTLPTDGAASIGSGKTLVLYVNYVSDNCSGHKWSDWTTTKSATCTQDGSAERTCSYCGKTETKVLDKTGHDWGAWTDNGDGNHIRTCKNDASHVEKAAHTWDDGVVTKPAGSASKGIMTYTCTVCGATRTEEIPAFSEITAQGVCGDNLTWTLYSDGTLVISGNGEMTEYVDWYSYSDDIKSIVIEDGVTSIRNNAFSACSAAASISIADSVTYIGGNAFGNTAYRNNKNNFENGVLYIGKYLVGSDSDSLQGEYEVKSGTTCIAEGALEGCQKLTKVTVPDSVLYINDCAFLGCPMLTDISVNENNKNYSSDNGVLFNKNKTELLQYPAGSKQTEYDIPDGVKAIGTGAFYMNLYLENVTIPNSVTKIGDGVFMYSCSLKNVIISDSVTAMGAEVFLCCFCLESVKMSNGLTEIPQGTFEYCCKLKNFVIPDSVKKIGDASFADCFSLESIVIPAGVETVEGSAFDTCISLKSFEVLNKSAEIGEHAFGYTQNAINGDISELAELNSKMMIASCTGDEAAAEALSNQVDAMIVSLDSPVVIDGFTIYGLADSTAQTYAKDNSIKFVVLGSECSHENTEVRNAKAATCTEKGYTGDIYCKDCGELVAKGTELAPIPHTELIVKGYAASCTSDGLTDGVECSVCGTVIKAQEKIPALGHLWSEWTVVTKATCVSQGLKTRKCSRCGEVENAVIPVDSSNHTGKTVVKNAKAATCVEDGYTGDIYCSDCGALIKKGEVIKATGSHTYGDWIIDREATCTDEGSEHRDCIYGDDTEVREIPTIEHEDNNWDGKCDMCGKRLRNLSWWEYILKLFNSFIVKLSKLFNQG